LGIREVGGGDSGAPLLSLLLTEVVTGGRGGIDPDMSISDKQWSKCACVMR
jgi:hypothetical protein